MRSLFLAAALIAGPAAPAAAQPRPDPEVAPLPAPPPPPPAGADAPVFTASTVAADLSGLNVRIEQDEVTLTRLRDAELARENAVIAAIKPALPFRDDRWFPKEY